jgi:hypothetical protein
MTDGAIAKDREQAAGIIREIRAKLPYSRFAEPGTTARVFTGYSGGYADVIIDEGGVEDSIMTVWDADADQLKKTCEVLELLTKLATCIN